MLDRITTAVNSSQEARKMKLTNDLNSYKTLNIAVTIDAVYNFILWNAYTFRECTKHTNKVKCFIKFDLSFKNLNPLSY